MANIKRNEVVPGKGIAKLKTPFNKRRFTEIVYLIYFISSLANDKPKPITGNEKAAKRNVQEQLYQNHESMSKEPDNTYCNMDSLKGIPVGDLKEMVAKNIQSDVLTNEYKVSLMKRDNE